MRRVDEGVEMGREENCWWSGERSRRASRGGFKRPVPKLFKTFDGIFMGRFMVALL